MEKPVTELEILAEKMKARFEKAAAYEAAAPIPIEMTTKLADAYRRALLDWAKAQHNADETGVWQ